MKECNLGGKCPYEKELLVCSDCSHYIKVKKSYIELMEEAQQATDQFLKMLFSGFCDNWTFIISLLLLVYVLLLVVQAIKM